MDSYRYKLARFTLEFRWLVLAIATGLTLFFVVGLKDVELRTIFSDLLPRDHPFVQVYKDHPNFGNPLTATIMVQSKSGSIYNAETLKKVWDMTRDADLAPGVDHDQILSISTEKARYAEATPDGINTQPLMGDHPPATSDEIAQFKRNVQMAPNAQKFLISGDGSATLIKITFIERILDYGKAFEHLQKLVEESRDADHNIYMAGQPVLTGWVYRYESQMLGIFAVTGLALLLSLIFYMRNVAGVVAPLIASFVAAIWGFGFVGWLKLPIEPLIMVVPLLLTARSFSHSVQYIERYYEILHVIGDKKKAAEVALSVMMAPSVLGIVTDAAGLFLIAVAPIPTMERFALFCGFWAVILIPANVFLTPLVLTFLPEPKNVARMVGGANGSGHSFIGFLLKLIAKLSHGRTAWVTTVVLIACVGAAIDLSLQLKIGNPVEGSKLLWDDSEYNTSVANINRNFPGLNTLEIIFEAKDPYNPTRVARQAETVAAMYKLQYLMERGENPPVATLSFADYLPEANRLFSGGDPRWAPLDLNDSATAAAAGALLFGTSPKAFSNVTDFEMQHSSVSLWYKDNKQETVDAALASAHEALKTIGTDFSAFRIRLGTGTIALQQSINDTVLHYQTIILVLLNIVMLVSCSYAYGSVVAGLLLLIPVNISNLFLGAVMEKLDIGLDVNTLPILAIGLGVGIDYGIYLLSRIFEEFQVRKNHGEAIVAAIATTGKAIFFTAIIILIGILPWYFLSDLKFLADMGLLLVLVMLINMIIALIVVPLLVWLIRPAFMLRKDIALGENVDLSSFMMTDNGRAPLGAD
ncbi:MAG: efflux RND transporter permease subunit [Parvibaculum sp.]|nr:efflux RND transporter permease subunit [Parvibaculum sp.]